MPLLNLLNMLELLIHEAGWCRKTLLVVRLLMFIAIEHICLPVLMLRRCAHSLVLMCKSYWNQAGLSQDPGIFLLLHLCTSVNWDSWCQPLAVLDQLITHEQLRLVLWAMSHHCWAENLQFLCITSKMLWIAASYSYWLQLSTYFG